MQLEKNDTFLHLKYRKVGTQFLVNDLGIERMAERVGSFLGLEQHENRRHQGVTLTHTRVLH